MLWKNENRQLENRNTNLHEKSQMRKTMDRGEENPLY